MSEIINHYINITAIDGNININMQGNDGSILASLIAAINQVLAKNGIPENKIEKLLDKLVLDIGVLKEEHNMPN